MKKSRLHRVFEVLRCRTVDENFNTKTRLRTEGLHEFDHAGATVDDPLAVALGAPWSALAKHSVAARFVMTPPRK